MASPTWSALRCSTLYSNARRDFRSVRVTMAWRRPWPRMASADPNRPAAHACQRQRAVRQYSRDRAIGLGGHRWTHSACARVLSTDRACIYDAGHRQRIQSLACGDIWMNPLMPDRVPLPAFHRARDLLRGSSPDEVCRQPPPMVSGPTTSHSLRDVGSR
jgi:hypothetical protein